MGPVDLEVRRPLWAAMSDLFLDTETRWSVPFVARCCAESRLGEATLDEVFWCEVFPLGIDNLHDLAGEWAILGVPDSQFEARVGKGERRVAAELTSGWMVKDPWEAVKACTRRLHREPPARWLALTRVWNALGHRFFEDPERTPISNLTEPLKEGLAAGLDLVAEWRFYEPIARSMASGDESHAPRVEAVLGLLEQVGRDTGVDV
jgi:hypothetical protein